MSWARSLEQLPVYRITAQDTNKFVLLCDPQADGTDSVQVIEIFDVGGATPPNSHVAARELFYVLAGQGQARVGGQVFALQPGSVMMVSPGQEHVVVNTGAQRLYCLTTMMPDEAFAALIKAGVPDRLDAEDIAVLCARR